MPVTLKQLAAHVGVSVPTVSLILNGKGERYSEATQAAVRRAADELGYRPNASARAMQSQRHRAAALLYRQDQSFLPLHLLRGLGRTLAAAEMHLVLEELTRSEIESESLYAPKLLRELCVDGLLVFHAAGVEADVLRLIQRQHIPTVWLHQDGDHGCVRPDDAGAMAAAVARLVALGHRRIAYLDFHTRGRRRAGLYDAHRDRIDGYRTGMRAAGLPARVVREPMPPEELYGRGDGRRVAAARALLAGDDRPTAVVTGGPVEALPTLLAAAALGLEVPADLSLVTVGERPCHEAGIALTTLVVPFRAEGQAAAEMLVARLRDPAKPQPSVIVPHDDPVGASIAPP